MTVDMANFTPWLSLLGGIIIGLATTLFLISTGRIAGISGILGGLLGAPKNDILWRVLFLLGLALSPLCYKFFISYPDNPIPQSWAITALAGFLVGLGTQLAGGCTSGHGVCGIARLSMRSIIATITFISFAIVTVFVVKIL